MPLDRVARSSAGNFNSGNLSGTGTPWLRSTWLAVVVNFGSGAGSANGAGVGEASSASTVRSPGSTTRVCEPSPSQLRPAAFRLAAVVPAMVSRSLRKQPGSLAYTAHSASASALPPKPPMRSRPRTKSARSMVCACASSPAVGPSSISRRSSSSMICSTRAGSTPCFTSAVMWKAEASSNGHTAVLTRSTSFSSCTRRRSRRELLLPPSTCDSTSRRAASASAYGATLQERWMRACGTLSVMLARVVPRSAGPACTRCRVGPAGMSPK